ncbi:MAG: hypothetical protein JNK44_15375 [Cyclobacteriaceae bacterium]|nr:hypothetical protein [Cyclobacteriaceae bacterium]
MMVIERMKSGIFFKTIIVLEIFLISALVFSGCRTPKPIYTHQQPQKIEKIPAELVILTFRIQEDSTSATSIELLDKHIIQGTLKGVADNSIAENRLIIKQEDIQHNVLTELSIDHPLIKYIEYVNEASEFETKLVRQRQAEFFIRMELKPQTSYLRIAEIRDGKETPVTQLKIR